MPFRPKSSQAVKLPKFQSADKGLEDALNLLARAIEAIEIPDIRLVGGTMEWSGRSLMLRPDPVAVTSGTSGPEYCSFGQIITWMEGDPAEEVTGINGGYLNCGDKNFNVDPHQILNLVDDSVSLVYLSLTGVDPATDDDNEIFLPGVLTATGSPEWDSIAWTADPAVNYPDNTNPTSPTGTGTIIIPIGKLTVKDGVATLERAGCGSITITQCAGILGFTRA